MRTRVHNNAGSEAVIRESFQMNIDASRTLFSVRSCIACMESSVSGSLLHREENSPDTLMTLLAKDQSLLANSEIEPWLE